jgi:hypothetical protein
MARKGRLPLEVPEGAIETTLDVATESTQGLRGVREDTAQELGHTGSILPVC